MTCLAFFPLMSETEFILGIWLGNVPEYSVTFTRLLLVVVLVASTAGGMLQLINASDKIKWFKIQSCFWSLLVLPIGYIIFKLGWESWWIFILFIVSDVLNRACQLYLMNRLLGFSSIAFIKSAYLRPLFVILLLSLYLCVYMHLNIHGNLAQFSGLLLTGVFTAISIWYIGITREERNGIFSLVKNKIKK